MRRFFVILMGLLALTIFGTLAAGCPADDDDDTAADDDDARELCSGDGCQNAATGCPTTEPDAGDSCTFNGNCHYCLPGSDQAEGYTCDGTSFTYQGTFDCNP